MVDQLDAWYGEPMWQRNWLIVPGVAVLALLAPQACSSSGSGKIECTSNAGVDACNCDFGSGNPATVATCDQTWHGGALCCAQPGYPSYAANLCGCDPQSKDCTIHPGWVSVSSCSDPAGPGSPGSGGTSGSGGSGGKPSCTAGGPGFCGDTAALNRCNCGAACLRDSEIAGSGYSCHLECTSNTDCAPFGPQATCQPFTAAGLPSGMECR